MSGRPRAAGKPFKKVGGEAPHLLEGFPGRPGPPRHPKSMIFPLNLAPPVSATPMCRPVTGASICEPCRVGTFQQSEGSTNCSICEAGMYNDGVQQRECKLCMPGSSSTAGAELCSLCGRGTYAQGRGLAKCAPCNSTLTTRDVGATTSDACGCDEGTYRASPSTASYMSGQTCTSCGEGLVCDGFGAAPRATPGYQLDECAGEACVFRCHQDLKRCPGGGFRKCAPGRQGVACGDCEAGKVGADDGSCIACKDGDSVLLIGAILGSGMLLLIMYILHRRSRSQQYTSALLVATSLAQMCVVCQTIAAVSRLTIEWIEPAASLIRAFSALSFHIEWLRLWCLGDMSTMSRYGLRVVIAPCCIVFLAMLHVLALIIRRFRKLGI